MEREETANEILDKILKGNPENECVEFKEAKNDFDLHKLGKYFSALSNEANLAGKASGWMIFGVEDKTRKIVGTLYRNNKAGLETLKNEIARGANGMTFTHVIELSVRGKRVLMFKIPSALPGIPTAWQGHYYGRHGGSLSALNIHEIEQIRQQENGMDWSACICEGAVLNDLDKKAILKARENYKQKHRTIAADVDTWSDTQFLNKAKITIGGKITRTAMILLGKEESERFLLPSVAKTSWILKDAKNAEKDYEHFGPPFILTIDRIFDKIRNLKYRYMSWQTIFPTEITMYEPYVIREALNNCIAHQDYEKKSRFVIVEKEDELVFTNSGSFIPGSVEAVIKQDAPQKYYRNQFLASAMANLNMIDVIGSGIKKMFTLQKNRFFPMPTYILDKDEVTLKIQGKILDENYTKLLMENTGLELETVLMLDKVQKSIKLTKEEFYELKKQKLVEGRYPKIHYSSAVAAVVGDKAKYIKLRGFNKKHYKTMILEYLKKYQKATRQEINSLLLDKMPDILDANQKIIKINNLLSEMSKKDKTIYNAGSERKPQWMLRP